MGSLEGPLVRNVDLDVPLGSGSFGVVQKVKYSHNNRSICLARKLVRPPYRKFELKKLRDEANIMEKLDHEHILKLVGTYCMRTELYLLLWPVAVCNLESFLTDVDCLGTGQGDREDIVNRMYALDLRDLSALERSGSTVQPTGRPGNCPLKYFQQIMGCITRAVAYCHQANVRHLDLKPSNILLNPGRVYLADFGIARDVHEREHTMTRGQLGTPKWRAPELHQNLDDWSMKAADVYSLGMVLLSIATLVHRVPLDDFDAILEELSPKGREEKLRDYLRKLESHALATQQVDDVNAPTFAPKHVVGLASRMLHSVPCSRPVIFQVDTELVELGGIEQVYHAPCCKRSNRFVTERMNTKLKLVVEERDRLRAEHGEMARRLTVLEAKEETYELRIMNERKTQMDNIAKLQAQLEKERTEVKRLKGLVSELQQQARKQPRTGMTPSATARQSSSTIPSGAGLTMRPRQRTQPLPTRVPQPIPPPAQSQHRNSVPATKPNLQLHSPQVDPGSFAPQTLAVTAARRDSLRASPMPSPGAHPPSPAPDTAGYPLHSRNSSSRLPRAVNPATPIRSNTPIFHKDPSSTDSTQYSMSDSIFSRRSLPKASLAGTSVAGTPQASPAMPDITQEPSNISAASSAAANDDAQTVLPGRGDANATSYKKIHGLGLGLTDRDYDEEEDERQRRESITSSNSGLPGAAGPASVSAASSGVPPVTASGRGTVSPVLSGSALSSPRLGFARLDGTRGAVPSLPTAQSWADVAARRTGRA
ncbi:hypothetical protein VTK26DRAFT_2822 [Humicola hyalothermophila]